MHTISGWSLLNINILIMLNINILIILSQSIFFIIRNIYIHSSDTFYHSKYIKSRNKKIIFSPYENDNKNCLLILTRIMIKIIFLSSYIILSNTIFLFSLQSYSFDQNQQSIFFC